MLEKKFFIGIDLGWKEKKTTGFCILEKGGQKIIFEENYCKNCKDIFGKDIFKIIGPYLKNTIAIAIDAPLTKGRGKGKMRLYEKFLTTEIFRKEKVMPIPPALMEKFCDFAREIRQKFEKRGFVLDMNLIEVFPTLVKKISGENLFFAAFGKNLKKPCRNENHPFDKDIRLSSVEALRVMVSSPNHQESALICAILAYLHSDFQTRYLGYKDGFLFLPQMSFWKKEWRQKFYRAWMTRSRLRYKHLITNIFVK